MTHKLIVWKHFCYAMIFFFIHSSVHTAVVDMCGSVCLDYFVCCIDLRVIRWRLQGMKGKKRREFSFFSVQTQFCLKIYVAFLSQFFFPFSRLQALSLCALEMVCCQTIESFRLIIMISRQSNQRLRDNSSIRPTTSIKRETITQHAVDCTEGIIRAQKGYNWLCTNWMRCVSTTVANEPFEFHWIVLVTREHLYRLRWLLIGLIVK